MKTITEGVYTMRNGETVTITATSNTAYPFIGSNGRSYNSQGKVLGFVPTPWDLVVPHKDKPPKIQYVCNQKGFTFHAGERYQTRDGKTITILHTHAEGEYPLLILAANNYTVRRYHADGRYMKSKMHKWDIITKTI